ncbi:VOC family protein [Motiliproteus coralliicola]|uniref:VOC family protein n=1 Tax=Motiliproteus coralliicola TaxID=2283196 RepID=A0A369WWL8_9GAMM|nr:VOC family protein [Motiliproteus coralliicola]RDE24936.1 VOC family protein [Motiliproteus coralliicola]
MNVVQLDHLVLTVSNIDSSVEFYGQILGMEKVTFGEGRIALAFGQQKINLHQHGNEFEPKADTPCPGSADLCFIIDQPLDQAIAHLNANNVAIIEGPVERTGASGKILSIYFRDPDGNLIEVSNQLEAD